MIQYSEASVIEAKVRGVLDTALEPVIGLAGGETRWRGTMAYCGMARCTAVALLALAMLWRSTRAVGNDSIHFCPSRSLAGRPVTAYL
jgi:hypothetical protein